MVHLDPLCGGQSRTRLAHHCRAHSQRGTGGRSGSLDHLEVVQDGHDVLRHEDVAGVDGHGGHGDEEGVWRRRVEETTVA